MTLTELRYTLAIAQEKHFGRAAVRCNVSQPTLSVAIKKLEQRLGVHLFERHHNQIRITDVGEKIITQAQKVIEEVALIENIASESHQQTNTAIKVGAIHTLAPYIFPSLIPALKTFAPNMPLIIQENVTQHLATQLQTGEIDVAFVALPFNQTNIVTKPVFDEAFVVLLPQSHPLAKQTSIAPQDLKNQNTLLLGKGHCFRDQVIQHCPECYQPSELQHAIEGSSLETLRHMVASGMGITVLPATATHFRHYPKTLCVRPFKTTAPKRTIALAWRASFPRTKAIDALIQALAHSKLSNICIIA